MRRCDAGIGVALSAAPASFTLGGLCGAPQTPSDSPCATGRIDCRIRTWLTALKVESGRKDVATVAEVSKLSLRMATFGQRFRCDRLAPWAGMRRMAFTQAVILCRTAPSKPCDEVQPRGAGCTCQRTTGAYSEPDPARGSPFGLDRGSGYT